MDQSKKTVTVTILITIFVLVVSLASLYVQTQIDAGTICSCAIPVPVLLPILSSIGLLVGTLIYYYMSSPNSESKEKTKPLDSTVLLNLIEGEDGKVFKTIIDNGGEMAQAKIVSTTGIQKVRVFRAIEKLKRKGLVTKEPHGKTNMIKVNDEISKLFSKS
ncbi:MAG: hypothetical protein KAS32_08165 [Candidatus Peribacteraceae bacterium]|nr:hypothetical protein [Candidatus Peribacteraceae bacterium]